MRNPAGQVERRNMKTEYLDELYPHQLKKKLSLLGVELTDDQYRTLLNRGRTFLYAPRERRKDKANFLYRLTILFYIVWIIFVRLVIQPLKWLFTGTEYFSMDNPIHKFTVKWGRKIGF